MSAPALASDWRSTARRLRASVRISRRERRRRPRSGRCDPCRSSRRSAKRCRRKPSSSRRRCPRVAGDGSAMYTCQALWTAAHDRVPVIFVILNNRSYRILKQRVNALKGHAAQTGVYVGMNLDDPPVDFVGLARALGLAAERVETIPQAIALLRQGLAGEAPLLIDVALDPAFAPV